MMLHGDDVAAVGPEGALEKLKDVLAGKYKVKTEVLGGGRADKLEVRILNRVVQWRSEGIMLEADPRHIEVIVKDFGLERGNDAATPGDRELFKKEAETQTAVELDSKQATQFRGAVARLNDVCSERPDIQYFCKELSRAMAKPTSVDVAKLKRLARYL